MRAHGRSALHASVFASLLVWVASTAIPAQAATAPVRLSIDLYTNTSSQHKTELEPDTFSFGSTIVSAFQVGRFFNGGASNIGWATSTDGGATWSHGFLPGITVYAGGTYDRASDPVVAYDAAHGDIVFTTTTDGVSWTPVLRIPIDAVGSGADHFIPGLGVDPATGGATAALGLTYYSYPDASCSTATCQLDVGFVSSADGGATWSEARRLAGPMNLGWLPATTQGYMVGDYVSTSVVSGTAVPLFAFAKRPVVVLRESAYASPVAVAAGTAAAQPGAPAVVGRGSPVGSTAPTAY